MSDDDNPEYVYDVDVPDSRMFDLDAGSHGSDHERIDEDDDDPVAWDDEKFAELRPGMTAAQWVCGDPRQLPAFGPLSRWWPSRDERALLESQADDYLESLNRQQVVDLGDADADERLVLMHNVWSFADALREALGRGASLPLLTETLWGETGSRDQYIAGNIAELMPAGLRGRVRRLQKRINSAGGVVQEEYEKQLVVLQVENFGEIQRALKKRAAAQGERYIAAFHEELEEFIAEQGGLVSYLQQANEALVPNQAELNGPESLDSGEEVADPFHWSAGSVLKLLGEVTSALGFGGEEDARPRPKVNNLCWLDNWDADLKFRLLLRTYLRLQQDVGENNRHVDVESEPDLDGIDENLHDFVVGDEDGDEAGPYIADSEDVDAHESGSSDWDEPEEDLSDEEVEWDSDGMPVNPNAFRAYTAHARNIERACRQYEPPDKGSAVWESWERDCEALKRMIPREYHDPWYRLTGRRMRRDMAEDMMDGHERDDDGYLDAADGDIRLARILQRLLRTENTIRDVPGNERPVINKRPHRSGNAFLYRLPPTPPWRGRVLTRPPHAIAENGEEAPLHSDDDRSTKRRRLYGEDVLWIDNSGDEAPGDAAPSDNDDWPDTFWSSRA